MKNEAFSAPERSSAGTTNAVLFSSALRQGCCSLMVV